MYKIILYSLCLISFSCSTDTSNEQEIINKMVIDENSSVEDIMFFDLMQPNAGGMFRGFHFDMKRAEIRETELARSSATETSSEKEDEMIITSDLGEDLTDFADIKYTFDDNGLYFINIETYLNTEEKSQKMYANLITLFEEKYGKSVLAEDGFLEFNTENENAKYIVSLKQLDLPIVEDQLDSYGFYLLYSMSKQ